MSAASSNDLSHDMRPQGADGLEPHGLEPQPAHGLEPQPDPQPQGGNGTGGGQGAAMAMPRGDYLCRAEYSGDELLADGSGREGGYLSMARGDQVRILMGDPVAGHSRNRYPWYIFGQKGDKWGWLPASGFLVPVFSMADDDDDQANDNAEYGANDDSIEL